MKKARLSLLFATISLMSWAADEAAPFAETVSPADRKAAAALVERGKVSFDKQKFDEAISEFTKALALDKTNKEAHEWLQKVATAKGWSTPAPSKAK